MTHVREIHPNGGCHSWSSFIRFVLYFSHWNVIVPSAKGHSLLLLTVYYYSLVLVKLCSDQYEALTL